MNNCSTSTYRYQITQEQLEACTRWVHENSGEVFYTVQSASDANTQYKVTWNTQYKVLQCTCIAAEHGNGCWHKRAVKEAASLYQEELQEQAQIEAYVRQGIDREIATRRVYEGRGFTNEEMDILEAESIMNEPFVFEVGI